MTPRRPSIDRFEEKVDKLDDGCWLWTASRDADGYGLFPADGHWRAHRWSYSRFVGPIPAGMLVCHRCDTPSCVRPDHLFLGTARDNTRDMWAKGRNGGGPLFSGAKTHCPQGHEYTPENTYYHSTRGYRTCRICARAQQRRWRASKRASSASTPMRAGTPMDHVGAGSMPNLSARDGSAVRPAREPSPRSLIGCRGDNLTPSEVASRGASAPSPLGVPTHRGLFAKKYERLGTVR